MKCDCFVKAQRKGRLTPLYSEMLKCTYCSEWLKETIDSVNAFLPKDIRVNFRSYRDVASVQFQLIKGKLNFYKV